jgi:hypothetical protein
MQLTSAVKNKAGNMLVQIASPNKSNKMSGHKEAKKLQIE